MGLVTHGMGSLHLATNFALAGREAEMEEAIDEALHAAPDALDVVAGVPGRARMNLAIRRADLAAARDLIDEAVGILRTDPTIFYPFHGLRALLHAVASTEETDAVLAETARATGADVSINPFLRNLATAVVAGREGKRDRAEAMFAEDDPRLHRGIGSPWAAALLRLASGRGSVPGPVGRAREMAAPGDRDRRRARTHRAGFLLQGAAARRR
jgi:hypothetical protein